MRGGEKNDGSWMVVSGGDRPVRTGKWIMETGIKTGGVKIGWLLSWRPVAVETALLSVREAHFG